MLFQICLIFITTMICNSYESDSESITSSQSSRSSRSYSSRNRSNSRDGRNSSIGSRGSSANEWMVLSEFEDLEAASDFLKTVLTKNATRTSTKPNCQFYDPQSAKKHKMHQQIRTCRQHVCSFLNVQPIEVFNWLNLESTRESKMVGLPQPKLHQI